MAHPVGECLTSPLAVVIPRPVLPSGTLATTSADLLILAIQALLVVVGGASLYAIVALRKWD
jgi:hypothetical protein